MTMTSEQVEQLELDALPETPDAWMRRTDENLRLIDHAFGERDARIAELAGRLAQKPERRPRRTGAPARLAADDLRFFLVILGGVVAFALASFTASFAGQYAMAANTGLPEVLWWLVPLFIDLPIIVLSLATLIFRARGQRVWVTWTVVIALTLLSSAINVAHVLEAWRGGGLDARPILGAVVMGSAPILVLISFEELGRLGIKPPEKKRPAPAVRKPATKRASK